MAIALGPQTDTLLHSLTEELKGKTQLTEPYVDKKTIIRAVREQNAILQTLQSQFVSSVHRMNEMESTLTKQNAIVETLQNKVRDLEAVAEKVSVIEDTLEDWRSKIALVDVLVEEVSNHSEQMTEIRQDVSQNERALDELRTNVDDNFKEVNHRVTTLTNDVRELPNTIQISSHQVHMSQATSSSNDDDDDDNNLTNAMMMQNGRCNLLEEGVSSVSAIIETHAPIISHVETTIAPATIQLRTDVDALSKWKEEQSNVDLMELRKGHDALELCVESLSNDMNERVVNRDEMQKKLDETFETIIDHLQTALVSTEKDEADFKAVTDNLNRMYEALREEKADKADIAKLRGQFIENHVECVAPSSGGQSGITNEQIRRLLVNYPTMDDLQRLLNAKADADVFHSRFDRTDRVLRGLSKIVDEFAVAKSGVDATSTAMDVSSNHDDEPPLATTTNDGHNTEKGFMLTEPLDSIDETHEESDIIPDDNATTSEVLSSSSSSSSLVGNNNNNNKTPSEQHLIVQLPQLATRLSPRRQRRLSAGDVDDFNDFINVRSAPPNDNNDQRHQSHQQRLFVRRSRSQTDLPDGDDNKETSSILPPPLSIASGNRLRVDRIYPSREKTTGSSSFVPASKYNNNNDGNNNNRNVKVTSQTIEFPIINKDRMRYNPGISYGGGYQLVPPTATNNNDKKKRDGSKGAPPLRALDQYKTVLPVVEKKKMVVGVDGKFYVSARVGNNGGTTTTTTMATQQQQGGGNNGGSSVVMMTTTTTPTTNATSEVTGRMDRNNKRDEALSNATTVGNTKII